MCTHGNDCHQGRSFYYTESPLDTGQHGEAWRQREQAETEGEELGEQEVLLWLLWGGSQVSKLSGFMIGQPEWFRWALGHRGGPSLSGVQGLEPIVRGQGGGWGLRGVGSGLFSLRIGSAVPGKSLLSVGIGSPWEGPSLQGQQGFSCYSTMKTENKKI